MNQRIASTISFSLFKTGKISLLAIVFLCALLPAAFPLYWCKVVEMSQTMFSADKDQSKNFAHCEYYEIANLKNELGLTDQQTTVKLEELIKRYVAGETFNQPLGIDANVWTVRTWDFEGPFTENGAARFDGFKRLLFFFPPKDSGKKAITLVEFEEYVFKKVETSDSANSLALAMPSQTIENTKISELDAEPFLIVNLRFGQGLFTMLMFNRQEYIDALSHYLDASGEKAPEGYREVGRIEDVMFGYNPNYDSFSNQTRVLENQVMVFYCGKDNNLILVAKDAGSGKVLFQRELSQGQAEALREALGEDFIKNEIKTFLKRTNRG